MKKSHLLKAFTAMETSCRGSFKSPAKVNLFFRVLSKRNDGYHEIATLMQAISLYDQIDFEVTLAGNSTEFICDDPIIPLDEKNTIIKALQIFKEFSKLEFSTKILLKKNIPIQAGLGGGSSNGATTLWALNELLQTEFSIETLRSLGSRIGSDVPFFLSSGYAFCTGRGEVTQDITPPHVLESFWVIKPSSALSTVEVYKRCTPHAQSKEDPQEILQIFKASKHCVNDLEPAACAILPELAVLKRHLQIVGLENVMMTGSGSSFIGFGHPLAEKLPNHYYFHVHPITRSSSRWYS